MFTTTKLFIFKIERPTIRACKIHFSYRKSCRRIMRYRNTRFVVLFKTPPIGSEPIRGGTNIVVNTILDRGLRLHNLLLSHAHNRYSALGGSGLLCQIKLLLSFAALGFLRIGYNTATHTRALFFNVNLRLDWVA